MIVRKILKRLLFVAFILSVLGGGQILAMLDNDGAALAAASAPVEPEQLRLVVGHAGAQGRRRTMEDEIDIHQGDKLSYFGVYDGHGGVTTAQYLKKYLCGNIVEALSYRRPEDAMIEAYKCTDKNFYDSLERESSNDRNSGSCALSALHFRDTNDVYVAWAGDSRAVFSDGTCAENGKRNIIFASEDHKPNKPSETDRIEKVGKRVELHPFAPIFYVVNDDVLKSGLAVSRAIGDFTFKDNPSGVFDFTKPDLMAVTPIPDVECFNVKEARGVLILACDGLWDVMSNQAAVNFVYNKMDTMGVTRETVSVDDAHTIANALVQEALWKGSTDNVSVVIVFFVPVLEVELCWFERSIFKFSL